MNKINIRWIESDIGSVNHFLGLCSIAITKVSTDYCTGKTDEMGCKCPDNQN